MKLFKRTLIAFFLLTSTVFAQELQKVRIDAFEGGMNTTDLAIVIGANQGTLYQNTVLNRKGQLSKRKGQYLFASDESNTAWTGLGVFNPDVNTSYIIAASGEDVVRTLVSPPDWININTGSLLTTGKDTEFIQANNLFFVLNGYDKTPYYDGATWTAGATFPTAPPVGSTAAWLRNYLFVAGDPSHTDWVYFSDNLTPQTFSAASNVFKVSTGDGQPIVRLEPFKLNELIIYKSKSIFILDITGTTPLTDWTLQPITTSIGCASRRSVVSFGNDHWFLSGEPFGVRSLVRSSYDKLLVDMVSQPIQDIFDGTGTTVLNTTKADKACAILFDNKYFLAIPTGTAIVNNYVVVYDFITKSWSVIDGWYPAAWVVFENDLYYMDALDGRVIKCLSGTGGDMASGPVTTAASDPTIAITFDYRSKDIDFGVPENYKGLDSIEFEFESQGNYTAECFINLDNIGWQSIGTINFQSDSPTLPNNLAIDLSSKNIVRKTFQLQSYGEYKKIAVRVVQNGVGELCNLHAFSIFSTIKPWRRE